MKENKYDDPSFFDSYSQMSRSVDGLNGAGEWDVLKKMLPELNNKTVLDLGCGYGWHCIYAHEQGAARVVGVDISEKMLEKARDLAGDMNIEFYRVPIEDIQFENEEFDIIISSLAFHYIKNLEATFKKIYNCLKKGGHFVFSIEHPVFTARQEQDWYTDEQGNRLHWPLDNYQNEGKRQAHFLGHDVTKYHRTLSSITNTLIKSGFCIKEMAEPSPSEDTIQHYPEMKDEVRRPIFLLLSAEKY